MDHIAIMKKSWKMIPKILQGAKVIESRWYYNKSMPWDKIKTGDTIYFKNSGEPVTIKAKVTKVLQFTDLDLSKITEILIKYGKKDGIDKNDIPKYIQLFKDKNYCILVFIKNPQRVLPFQIIKQGYGAMAAWISIDNICRIKK